MARERKKLTLGKGVAFVKSRLKRLPQVGENWEADFKALPKPLSQNETHYLGLVVVRDERSVLAEEQIEQTPDVNDLATLLAHAMRRPLHGRGHRPKRVRVSLPTNRQAWPRYFCHCCATEPVSNSHSFASMSAPKYCSMTLPASL